MGFQNFLKDELQAVEDKNGSKQSNLNSNAQATFGR